jgi:hypothetical protein
MMSKSKRREGFIRDLKYLEVGKEVLLQPVFEVPNDEMLISYIRMKQRLVAEIPASSLL